MIGYTPNRFRYEVVWPNNPTRYSRPQWQVMTWDEVTAAIYALMENAGDPIFEIRIIPIDPNVPDTEES